MSILSTFGIDASAFAGVTDPSLFSGSGTTMMRLDKKTPYSASINGHAVNAYVTLREAKLTRLSLLRQTQVSSAREYNLVTGIMKPVKFDIDLIIDGETMSLTNLLKHFAEEASGTQMSEDDFILAARRIGFNIIDGMPLFFQQFGADGDKFEAAVEAFRSAGAVDAKGTRDMGRIRQAWAHSSGVDVTALELGTVNREMSPRGQGFLNLVDAQVDQFQRILGLRMKARTLKAEAAKPNLAQNKIKSLTEAAKVADEMSQQWRSSWSGAQQRIENANGTYVPRDIYDPVNAPCGRFTMVIGGNEVNVDLWTNSSTANNTEVAPSKPKGEPEPF